MTPALFRKIVDAATLGTRHLDVRLAKIKSSKNES
jgi:hypothetical protein